MLDFYKFFTIWVFILTILHQYTHKIFSMSFLTFIVMFNGLYLSYINPGKYVLHDGELTYYIDGYEKFLVDAFLHVGVFLFIFINYGLDKITDPKILPSLLLIMVYGLIYYPPDVYLVPFMEMTGVFICSIIAYMLACTI